jgi:hypothetical protein
MASVPGDFTEVQLLGRVLGTHVVHHRITGILLRVKVTDDDPCVIAITPVRPLPKAFTQRCDRLWVRGRLACHPSPERKSWHFIEAIHLEVVRRRPPPASTLMAIEEGRAS